MALRDSRFAGFKFRRQDVIGQRIVDFFCPAKGLVIEVDGETHDAEADKRRDLQMLRASGFTTVRLTNADVMGNLEGCLTRLKMVLEDLPERWAGAARHHPPAPPLKRRGSNAPPSHPPARRHRLRSHYARARGGQAHGATQ
ncbi:MAG: endonuclease domain-containing protein [Erythrobacter sp.]|nr:endonuclease domain-containing protein [Erythrobacter sp.]